MLENLITIANNLFAFILVTTIIVFIHEMGHFYFARLFGVKVEVFSIGFGKAIYSKIDKHGTTWKICWIPAGGYVKMYGDADPSSASNFKLVLNMSQKEKSKAFYHKKLWQKFMIVVAGPLSNYLLAIVILFFLGYTNGIQITPPLVGSVEPESPAANAGILPGDLISEINEVKIKEFKDVQKEVFLHDLINPLTITAFRGGELITFNLLPKIIKIDDGMGSKVSSPVIGINSINSSYHQELNPYQALARAVQTSISISKGIMKFLGQIISGNRNFNETMGGPVKIARIAGKSIKESMSSIMYLTAVISINLGFFNLLPIPALDGGHIFFYIIQAIARRPIPPAIESFFYKIGGLILISLIIYVFLKDILELFWN